MRIVINFLILLTLLFGAGCASDMPVPGTSGDRDGHGILVLRVNLLSDSRTIGAKSPSDPTRGGFDNFDLEADKWGIPGENMESLRIIIADRDGNVEHNSFYTLSSDTEAGEYEFRVKDNDRKTIILLANEGYYHLDEEGMELIGGTTSLPNYFASFKTGDYIDMSVIRRLTLPLSQNSIEDRGLSLKTPLPISAIYEEDIPLKAEVIPKEYDIHRAAVKYSFRILNLSSFDYDLNELRIDRIANREYLFPDADFEVNNDGHSVMKAYRTPATASEQEYHYDFTSPLRLPAKMNSAITACAPVYVPEGLKGEAAQRISLKLSGQDLSEWKDLEWIMPGESQSQKRPMVDLPRNSHVVVNITIRDRGMEAVADVQPYAGIDLYPFYGLDRDENGNIIKTRYPDGTYDIIDDGNVIRMDPDGDEVLKYFKDGTLLIKRTIYKDYIHEASEIDYEYTFEKDVPGGSMVLIREITGGGEYVGESDDEYWGQHEHEKNDRPLFIIDKKGVTYRVSYDASGERTLHTTDVKGDEIVQANGFQFREEEGMENYLGTYIVRLKDGKLQLRWFLDARDIDYDFLQPIQTESARSSGSSNNIILKNEKFKLLYKRLTTRSADIYRRRMR